MGLQPADLFVIRRGTDGYYVPALRASGEPRNVPKRRVQSSADDRLAAVELIEWDGCSIADVADLLETSVGSVYAWRRQLRDQITTRERAAAKPVAQGEAAPGEPAACGSGPTEVSYALGRDMGPKPSAVPQAGRAGSNWKMAVVGKELTKTDTGESRTHTNGVNCDNAFVGFFRDERGALPDAITAVDSAGRLWRLEIRKYGTAPQYRLVGQAMGYIRANQLRSGDELRFEKIPVPGTFSISHVRLTGGDHVPSGSAAYPSQRGKTDRRRPRTPLARVVAAR